MNFYISHFLSYSPGFLRKIENVCILIILPDVRNTAKSGLFLLMEITEWAMKQDNIEHLPGLPTNAGQEQCWQRAGGPDPLPTDGPGRAVLERGHLSFRPVHRCH